MVRRSTSPQLLRRWRAFDPAVLRRVAISVPFRRRSDSDGDQRRFVRHHVQILAPLLHVIALAPADPMRAVLLFAEHAWGLGVRGARKRDGRRLRAGGKDGINSSLGNVSRGRMKGKPSSSYLRLFDAFNPTAPYISVGRFQLDRLFRLDSLSHRSIQ